MTFGFGMGFPRNAKFAGGPSLNLQFAGSQVLPSALSFSRLSNATYFDQTGVLRPAAFNSIRNNTMVGAIAGTPGTAPTNWVAPGAVNGLTQTVVSVGTENGISYIDVRYNGTTSAASAHQVSFEAANFIAAASGQTWSRSVFLKIVAGTTVNLTINNVQQGRDAANTTFTESFQTDITSSLSSTLNRFSTTSTLINASTAFVRSAVNFVYSSGVAIDITLRIGMPQLELGSVATPVIATSGSAAGAPRFDYSPTTLAPLGLLIEEQRTNSVTNNTMVGAVAGTPGTVPTSWQVGSSANGITRTVVGTGVEDGIAYIDLQYAGTSTAASGFAINQISTVALAAVYGQTWTGSAYVRLVGGSTANWTNISLRIAERTAAGVPITSSGTSFTPTSAALKTQRVVISRTLNVATTERTNLQVQLDYPSGVTVDITLRIGLPQFENNAISTGVSSATVQAGGTGYTNGDTLTVVGGTGTAATLTVTGVSAGVITSVSVATAGSYSVFPTSPASVTGGTGTLATFNLVPVTQSGFATSVILTSTAAATRSADNCSTTTLSPWFNATEGTAIVNYRTGADLINTRAAAFDDGGFNNVISYVGGTSSGGGAFFQVFDGGVSQALLGPGANLANTPYKTAGAYKASDFAASFNGSATTTVASGTVPTVTTLRIGQQLNSGYLNGWVQSFSYYPRRMSNEDIRALSLPTGAVLSTQEYSFEASFTGDTFAIGS